MDKQRLTYLVERHLAEELTDPEQQELSMIVSSEEEATLFKTILAEMMVLEAPVFPANPERWQQLAQHIIDLDRSPESIATTHPGRFFRLYRWSAAVVLLLLSGLGIYFLMDRNDPSSGRSRAAIIPALVTEPVSKNVLTLWDGTQVLLDEVKNGKIGSQENTTITKQDTQITYTNTDSGTGTFYNVISTARGGQYEVILSDGSHVWLNAASSLRFPASFSNRERSVELSGEAFFDVKHADKVPFLIHSGPITTSVLGTAFDVKAYPGQKTTIISLQQGRVKVQTGSGVLATLEKGQQLRVVENNGWSKKVIDPSAVAAWKSGDLIYKDERLEDIVADLERTFAVSIEIKRTLLKKELITVSFHKREGLEKALQMICRMVDGRLSGGNGIFIIE